MNDFCLSFHWDKNRVDTTIPRWLWGRPHVQNWQKEWKGIRLTTLQPGCGDKGVRRTRMMDVSLGRMLPWSEFLGCPMIPRKMSPHKDLELLLQTGWPRVMHEKAEATMDMGWQWQRGWQKGLEQSREGRCLKLFCITCFSRARWWDGESCPRVVSGWKGTTGCPEIEEGVVSDHLHMQVYEFSREVLRP